MRPARDELFDWILSLGPTANYNLTSSGLTEPDLRGMGVDTSFERFATENDNHERVFTEEVAKLYRVEPDNVIITNGGSEAIFLAYSVFGTRGAVVPLPNYPPMFTIPSSLGVKVLSTVKSRPRYRGTIFGLTDPNNPTGRSLDDLEAEALIDSVRRTEATVYINETYNEFTFPVKPQTRFGGADNVITSNTMTKFFGLGRLRVGWILAEKRRARQLLYGKWAVSGHDSEYSLWIATQVLRKRARFVERARQIRLSNVGHIHRFLEETPGISSEVGVAPFCLVRYRERTDSVALARRVLEETGVLIAPGDFFGAPGTFRLCFTADERTLRRGLAELSDFISKRSS